MVFLSTSTDIMQGKRRQGTVKDTRKVRSTSSGRLLCGEQKKQGVIQEGQVRSGLPMLGNFSIGCWVNFRKQEKI